MQNQSNNELDRLAEELTLCREVDESGTIRYYNEKGKRHRLGGPAVTWADGAEFWYQNGRAHRLNGPAVIFPSGTECWYIDGEEYTKAEFNTHPLVVQYRAKTVL